MRRPWYVYGALLLVSVVTAGGSILFLSTIDTSLSLEYPALSFNADKSTGFFTNFDAYEYAELAKSIVEHGTFSESLSTDVPDTLRTPGYPLFLAAFWAVFGSFYPVLIAQILIVFLTSILIFKMARKLLDPAWAFAAALIYIVLPDTILSASMLLTENLFLFLFMGSLYLLFFSQAWDVRTRWVLGGVLFAIAAYVRPEVMYLPILLIPGYFALYSRTIRREPGKHIVAALLFIFVFVGALVPWYVRNYDVSGAWGMSSVGAYTIFDYDVPWFLSTVYGQNTGVKANLETAAGLPVGPVPLGLHYSAGMEKAAFAVIFAHPVRFTAYYLTTTISFFLSSGAHDYWRVYHDMMPDFNPAPEPSLAQAINQRSLPLLITDVENHGWFLLENLFWAVITLLVLLGLWRSKDVRLAGVCMLIVVYFALVTGPLSYARYRIPADPLLIIVALSAASYFWQKKNAHA